MLNALTLLSREWTMSQIMHLYGVKVLAWVLLIKCGSVKKMDKYHVCTPSDYNLLYQLQLAWSYSSPHSHSSKLHIMMSSALSMV